MDIYTLPCSAPLMLSLVYYIVYQYTISNSSDYYTLCNLTNGSVYVLIIQTHYVATCTWKTILCSWTLLSQKNCSLKSFASHIIRFSQWKKVMSDISGLVDFAIRLVNSVLFLPKGQVKIFGELQLQKYCKTNVLNS